MAFPEIRMEDWMSTRKDILWLTFKDVGIQINAGESTSYIRKTNKDTKFKQFLFTYNIYGRGVVAMTWALIEVRDGKRVTKSVFTKILKDGKWIHGILNKLINFYRINDIGTGKSRGLKLKLQTGPKIFTELDILKAGGKFT